MPSARDVRVGGASTHHRPDERKRAGIGIYPEGWQSFPSIAECEGERSAAQNEAIAAVSTIIAVIVVMMVIIIAVITIVAHVVVVMMVMMMMVAVVVLLDIVVVIIRAMAVVEMMAGHSRQR